MREPFSISHKLQLNFLHEHEAHFVHLSLNKNRSTFRSVIFWKSRWFQVLHRNPHSPEHLESAIVIDKTPYSN